MLVLDPLELTSCFPLFFQAKTGEKEKKEEEEEEEEEDEGNDK